MSTPLADTRDVFEFVLLVNQREHVAGRLAEAEKALGRNMAEWERLTAERDAAAAEHARLAAELTAALPASTRAAGRLATAADDADIPF